MKFRTAESNDLEFIVEMLADDELGEKREDYRTPLPDCYIKSF